MGGVIFELINYQNDWDGANLNDGVYFYILTLCEQEEGRTGYVHLIRDTKGNRKR